MATYQNSYANLGVKLVITNQSPDIANNRTTINYSAYVYKSNGNPYNLLSSTPMYLTINGTSILSTTAGNYDLRNTSQQLIKSGTLTIPHNSDGTKSFSFSWNVNFTSTGYGYGNVTTSGTYDLPNIPRTSSFSLASSINTGTNYTLTITPSSTSFRHDVTYTVGGTETSIATGATTSATVNIPHTFFNSYPSSNSVSITVTVKTKNGTTIIGTRSTNITVNLPTSFIPTVTGLSVANTKHSPLTSVNQYIKGISRMTLTASSYDGSYSSKIVSFEFRYKRASGAYEGLVSTSNNSYQYQPFNFPSSGSEAMDVEVRVKDSRGRYSSWKTMVSAVRVHHYQAPSIGNMSVKRSGATNTSLIVTRNYTVTGLYTGGGTTNNNVPSLKFETRVLGGTESVNTGATSGLLSLTNSNATLSGTFAADKSYEVRAILSDSIQTVTGSWMKVATESLPMAFHPNGIGVGRAHSGSGYNLEVGDGGAKIDGDLIVGKNFKIDGELVPTLLLMNTDLNDITSPGFYYNHANAHVQTMLNKPTGNAFAMLVMRHAGVVQIVFEYMVSGAKTFIRNYYNGAWGGWRTLAEDTMIDTIFNSSTFLKIAKDGVMSPTQNFNADTFLHGVIWCYGGGTGLPTSDGLLYAYNVNGKQASQVFFGRDNKMYQRQRDFSTQAWGAWSTDISGNGSASSSGYILFGEYQLTFGKININQFYSQYTLNGSATFYRAFIEPPVVTLTGFTGADGNYYAGDAYVKTVTNSGFSASFANSGFASGTSRTANYIAIGKGR